MTVKEISDFFEVSAETVRSAVKRTRPDLLRNGIKTELSRDEVLTILPLIKIPADRTLRPTKILELTSNYLELAKPENSILSELQEIRALLTQKEKIDFFTVAGWCKLQDIQTDRAWLNQFGRDCRKLSDAQGFEVRRSEHEIYGFVNLYHRVILSQVCKEYK